MTEKPLIVPQTNSAGLPNSNQTPESVPSTSLEGGLDCVFVVIEGLESLQVRSVRIQKESSKALILVDSILLPNNPHPKRLLIKGLDIYATSKEEAVNQYIDGLNNSLQQLEEEKLRLQQLLVQATNL